VRMPPLVAGRVVRRDNRFRVTVEISGETVAAHLANSGRLSELLVPGALCWVAPNHNPGRKTRFDLKLVQYDDELVSIDATLPNALFGEAFSAGILEPFAGFECHAREVGLGKSRFDFRLDGRAGTCWVETKSVTLVVDGEARFPDAPTLRGAKHVRELAALSRAGECTAIVFVVQRDDARVFAPHWRADPAFCEALASAARDGVVIYAWSCSVGLDSVTLHRSLPVCLADYRR